ncbi:MAG: MerR family transcriptional regulator [Eubacterium sp.]
MSYTIKQVSEMTNIPATTLRYYDKEGLLPFLERKESGYRVFNDGDIAMLQILECLKSTGMSIQEMKQFSKWAQEGDDSLEQRYEMFLERKKAVEAQIEELQKMLDVINHKCTYYETAIKAGTEKNIMKTDKLPYANEFLCKTIKSTK